MNDIKYPTPDRSDFMPNLTKKGENDIVDLDWAEGVFPDGRPFRVEHWRRGIVTVLTFFFSSREIEGWSTDDLRHYLEEADLVFFAAPFQFVEAQQITDPAGNRLWSVNVVEIEGDVSYVENKVPLQSYEGA